MTHEQIMNLIYNALVKQMREELKDKMFSCGISDEKITFKIDGQKYVLIVRELGAGEHWNEMCIVRKDSVWL